MPSKNRVTIDPHWLGKEAAAKRLGVGVRQLENRASKGEIRKDKLPRQSHERVAPVVYSIEDIDAILAGRPNQYDKPEPSNAEQKPEVTALAVPAAADPFAGLPAHLAALSAFAQQFAPPEKKPWLTLDEAVEFSGLSRSWLLKAAESYGESAVAIRDMGKGARGGRWRFMRESLTKA